MPKAHAGAPAKIPADTLPRAGPARETLPHSRHSREGVLKLIVTDSQLAYTAAIVSQENGFVRQCRLSNDLRILN